MKIQISLSNSLPPQKGVINTFVLLENNPALGAKGTRCYVPNQDTGVYSGDAKFLRSIKVRGWDYLPEVLNDQRLGDLAVFTPNSAQREQDVDAKILSGGYKLHHIEVSASYLQSLHVERKPEIAVDFYGRVRYMWKHHYKKMSSWEANFTASVGKRLAGGKSLTSPQLSALITLLDKYEVPVDAHA